MRAIVCERLGDPARPLGEGPLALVQDHPPPECGPRGVRIRVQASSLNFADMLQIQVSVGLFLERSVRAKALAANGSPVSYFFTHAISPHSQLSTATTSPIRGLVVFKKGAGASILVVLWKECRLFESASFLACAAFPQGKWPPMGQQMFPDPQTRPCYVLQAANKKYCLQHQPIRYI